MGLVRFLSASDELKLGRPPRLYKGHIFRRKGLDNPNWHVAIYFLAILC